MICLKNWKNLTKHEQKSIIFNAILVLFGNLSLAFGTAIFLTRLDIVAGGLSGIAIIVQHYVQDVTIFGGVLAEIVG